MPFGVQEEFLSSGGWLRRYGRRKKYRNPSRFRTFRRISPHFEFRPKFPPTLDFRIFRIFREFSMFFDDFVAQFWCPPFSQAFGLGQERHCPIFVKGLQYCFLLRYFFTFFLFWGLLYTLLGSGGVWKWCWGIGLRPVLIRAHIEPHYPQKKVYVTSQHLRWHRNVKSALQCYQEGATKHKLQTKFHPDRYKENSLLSKLIGAESSRIKEFIEKWMTNFLGCALLHRLATLA